MGLPGRARTNIVVDSLGSRTPTRQTRMSLAGLETSRVPAHRYWAASQHGIRMTAHQGARKERDRPENVRPFVSRDRRSELVVGASSGGDVRQQASATTRATQAGEGG